MEDKTIDMRLLRYSVNKIHYEINEKYEATEDVGIEVLPQLNRRIEKIDENKVLVLLKCIINQDNMPFRIEVEVSGAFGLENWECDGISRMIAGQNTVAILYPYLRALISNITVNSHMAPYILPIGNIAEMFKEKKQSDE